MRRINSYKTSLCWASSSVGSQHDATQGRPQEFGQGGQCPLAAWGEESFGNLTTKWCILKYISPTPIQKTALFCTFSNFNFSSIFPGGSTDPIWPHLTLSADAHDASRICCRSPAIAARRPQLSIDATERRTDGRTDARPLRRSCSQTMRAASRNILDINVWPRPQGLYFLPRASAGFWLGVDAPLPPEAKKILKIWRGILAKKAKDQYW